MGSRASPYRRYCGQHAFVQPLAATAVDASDVKVSDEDAYLSRNMTNRANNGVVKELSVLDQWEKSTARDVTHAVTLVLPVDEASKSFLEVVTGAQKLVDAVQLVAGLAFDSANEGRRARCVVLSLEAHSTFTNESHGRLFIEMSLMADTGGSASSQTETSSPSALKISFTLKNCSSQVYLVKEPADPLRRGMTLTSARVRTLMSKLPPVPKD